ncbi:MAG: hypothetical protein GX974_09995 [Clostridiales bacterium]|nr:hypothetical protein [Clostridiales bacterium]
MNRAIYIDNAGQRRIVTAREIKDLGYPSIRMTQRCFQCPECREYVAFVRPKDDNHESFFRHGMMGVNNRECSLRVGQIDSSNEYGGVDLSIYLRKATSTDYELYMGFDAINTSLLTMGNEKGWQVAISDAENKHIRETIYHVNSNNFSHNSRRFKKLDFISNNYLLIYNKDEAKEELRKWWGSDVEGIKNGSALFRYTAYGGQKFRKGDIIRTYTEYLYLDKDKTPFEYFSDVDYELLGELLIRDRFSQFTYKIYKIEFRPEGEGALEKLRETCRSYLDLELEPNLSTFTPIWPPCVRGDEGLSYLEEEGEMLFLLHSTAEDIDIISRIDIANFQEEVEKTDLGNDNYLVSVPGITDKKHIIISTLQDFNHITIASYEYRIQGYRNTISIWDSYKKPIAKGKFHSLPQDRTIWITAKSKCNILHFRKGRLYKRYKIRTLDDIAIDNIRFNDEIIAQDGFKRYLLVCYRRPEKLLASDVDDSILYESLRNLRGPLIYPPIWLKELLLLLKDKPKTSALIKNYLHSNKYPMDANIKLIKLYRERVL